MTLGRPDNDPHHRSRGTATTSGRPSSEPPHRPRSAGSQSTSTQSTSRYATPEPEPETETPPPGGGLLQHIYNSPDFIISYGGSSQYQSGGVSACGLAALNCVRVILGKEQDGIRGEALLREIASQRTTQDITSICAQWSGSAHLEVEDIVRIPLFQRCLTSWATYFERPSAGAFKDLLARLQESTPKNVSAAVVITRPPEIITCMKIATPFGDVFVIFDSHPRPSHPDGAGFIFNTSIDATAAQLSELMSVDRKLLSDRQMQWQAQLLANFSGIFLRAKSKDQSVPALKQTISDASLEILNKQGQVAELKSENAELKDSTLALRDQNSTLVATNAQLQEEISALRQDLADARRRIRSLESQGSGSSWIPSLWGSGSSASYSSASSPQKDKGKNKESSNRYVLGPPRPQYNLRDREDRRPPPPKKQAQEIPPPRISKSEQEDLLLAQRLQSELNTSAIRDAALAARLQRQFEEEDSRIVAEQRELLHLAQPTFECEICLDEAPEEDIARIPACNHSFCRECLRGHILSRIQEHRYPIFCPSCSAAKTDDPSVITDTMVHEIGIDEREYVILEEMSLASFSVLLHCRQCQNSLFVARDEYQENKILACPLPACNYMWCKQCQQPVMPGEDHSCDGSKEFERLMNERGWKHCPGCKTPIQKESGCNHMTCSSPGCNMHFCYRCGGGIIASARPAEVSRAISDHYVRCNLFEDLPDRGIPP